jgi:hypothetical protein
MAKTAFEEEEKKMMMMMMMILFTSKLDLNLWKILLKC